MTTTERRQPWLKWFPSDWRAEPRLRMVCRASRSLWLDMIGLMHEAEPYGFLIVANQSLRDAATIARALGDHEDQLTPLLAALEAAGVFSRVGDESLPEDIAALIPAGIPNGTILSRKMLRDRAKAEKDKANGGKGGNPQLKAGDNEGVNPRDKGGVKAQKPEARVQSSVLRTAAKDGTRNETQTNPSLPRHSSPADDKSWLFGDGVAWLKQFTGRPEKGLRSLVGSWLRKANEDAAALRATVEAARDQGVADPLSWIPSAIARRAPPDPFEQTDDIGWRKRFESYAVNRAWPRTWGGSKPGDHPQHPAHLLAEYGHRKVA